MKKNITITPGSLLTVLGVAGRYVSRYAIILLFVLLLAVYGFVLLRIDVLSGAQPDSSDVSAQVNSAAIPHIDPTVLNQMQALQDNSVSIQALFNQARSNPFQE